MIKKKKLLNYFWVGVTITVTDYAIYEILTLVVFKNIELLWLATMIAGFVATIVGYLLHNNITWKERDPGKYGVIKFFAWNAFMMEFLRPMMAVFFKTFTGLYQWVFELGTGMGINWSLDFVTSTGVFGFLTFVSMFLNFMCYEKIVFGKSKDIKTAEADKHAEH